MNQPGSHTTTKPPRRYDVEVLTSDDLWAKYGTPLPDPAIHTSGPVAGQRFRWRRWGVYSAGTLFTGLLHLLLITTMLLGTAGRPLSKPTPLTEGAAASNPNDNATEFVSTLIILNDHSITPPDQPPDESAYAPTQALEEAQQQAEAVLLASLEAVQPPEVTMSGSADGTDAASPTAEATTGDAAGRAMLFGRC